MWAIGPYFRDTTGADWVTLPQAFKQAGYITGGAGKLFHTGAPSGFLQEKDNATGKEYVVRYGDDYPMSWTLPYNQNVDIMPADGQYPNDTHPKYPANFRNRQWVVATPRMVTMSGPTAGLMPQ